jgi:hypothetical protein
MIVTTPHVIQVVVNAVIANSIDLITSYIPGGIRSDVTGLVGVKFSLTSNVIVQSLGLLHISGHSSNNVYLLAANGNVLANTVVNSASVAIGHFSYNSIPAVHLSNNSTYMLVVPVTKGFGFPQTGPVTMTVATNIEDVAGSFGGTFTSYNPNAMFFGVDLQYTLNSSPLMTLTNITLSNNVFVANSPSGTIVGTITVS